MVRNLDTSLLRAFVAVWESNSFTKASEALFRTQAAVSMQVKRLEDQIGKSIFFRGRQGLKLTDDGEVLLTYARKILHLNDEVLTTIENPGYSGTVRIGAPDDFAAVLLPNVLLHFGEALPQVKVEIVCGTTPYLVQEAAAGNLDLALVSTLPDNQEGEVIRQEQLFWVTAEDNALENCDPLPLALFPNGCVCRNVALRALRNTSRSWRIVLASNNISTILASVSAGLAVTVMEDCVVPLHSRRLTGEDGLPELGTINITLYRGPGELSKEARVLSEYLRTCLREPAYSRIAVNPLSLRGISREPAAGILQQSD